jgi:hypothetical protein
MQDEPTTLPYATLEPEALLQRVSAHGWAVIEGMPCRAGNGPLLELANSLGRVNLLGASEEARDGEGVHLVKAMPRAVLDATGKAMLSNTATDFPLHTDECFARVPSQYVLLHCWNEDAGGNGDSLLASSEAVAARLEPWALDLCHRAHFVWRSCRAPIFSRQPGLDWPLVRFNLREIAGDDLDETADLRARALPEVFLAAANAAADHVLLEAGDCLVIDNRRILHGRVAFDPASKRLLKRVWVRAAEAVSPQDEANAKNRSTAAAG